MKVKADKKFLVNADIDSVWTVITNPEKIVVCVPGAQLTETIDEDHFNG
jgi:carbon monoxide dehydrogenase subunit G